MESIAYSDRTCIVVVEIEGAPSRILIGSIVDSVSEMLNIKDEDIENAPTLGAKLNTESILGMAKMEGGLKILLNIDHVLDVEKLARFQEMD
jgi:purine-binding chemotaxis protein CheW